MALQRWMPSDTITDFHQEVDRLFDNFFGRGTEETSVYRFTPVVDIEETEKEFQVTAELPGLKKGDVNVRVKDNLLTISGEKKQTKKDKDKNYRRTERAYGAFERTFRLPSAVERDKIDANFKDGLLEITIPKSKEAISKEIDVKVK